tara:strand:+ start:196 stop:681 length:486 start_codon:yes stop_codon:yes gene_type:complete
MISKNTNFLNLFFFSTSLIILLIVYYLEFFLNYKPCELCIYQRIPYLMIVLLSISYLLIKNISIKKKIFFLYILIFFSSLILSTYHFGIENNLWQAITECETDKENMTNNEDIKNYLLNKNYISCSDVLFKLFGISLAGYNIVISFILFVISIIGFKKIKN